MEKNKKKIYIYKKRKYLEKEHIYIRVKVYNKAYFIGS